MSNRYIIYHKNCRDGQFAAYAAYEDGATLHAWDLYEDLTAPEALGPMIGKDVVFVDCSPNGDAYQRIYLAAESLTVIDHHKTALHLADVPGCHISMEHSGAVLSWLHFHPDEPLPDLYRIVEDRDLWRFQDSRTKAVTCALSIQASNFDPLSVEYWIKRGADYFAEIGEYPLRYQRRLVEGCAKQASDIRFAGCDILAVNCGVKALSSDIGAILADDRPFSLVYTVDANGTAYCSLRSSPMGLDVSVIASLFGGGGHKHAAGCRIPYSMLAHSTNGWPALSEVYAALKATDDASMAEALCSMICDGASIGSFDLWADPDLRAALYDIVTGIREAEKAKADPDTRVFDKLLRLFYKMKPA